MAVPRRFAWALRSTEPEPGKLNRHLIGKPCRPTFSLDDFAHVGSELDLLKRLISGALDRREIGVNILLYGQAGTGKTELSKTLAAEVGAALYAIGEEDELGLEPSRGERLTQLRLSQRTAAGQTRALVLFDEMDDLLADAGLPGMFGSSRRFFPAKVYLHRLLEETPVPTLWTCNDLDGFEPACLRRMSYIIELRSPPPSVQIRLWNQALKRHEIAVDQSVVEQLVDEVDLTPALIEGSIQAAAMADGDITDLGRIAHALDRASHHGRSRPPSIRRATDFELALVNAFPDPATLLTRLEAAPSPPALAFLLHGPPGTGKSQFARQIGKVLGMSVVDKRASDLLSKYVGETENRIATAFTDAAKDGGLLIIDEADSFLFSRGMANRSWELTAVNEFLSWLDVHPLPVICTTNLIDRIDQAALRRFTVTLAFDYLTTAQTEAAFRSFFKLEPPLALSGLNCLTPADFALAARKMHWLVPDSRPEAMMSLLRQQCMDKADWKAPIGFVGGGQHGELVDRETASDRPGMVDDDQRQRTEKPQPLSKD